MNLEIFRFEDAPIRFVDGKPVANDVAAALGYADPAKTISTKVKPKNKGVTDLVTPGGTQSVTVLEESGIYQLIFGSKLPAAEKFQDWVFEEVLPSIRKTGQYQAVSPQAKQHAQLVFAILDRPDPWKRFYEKDFCDRAFNWFGAQFYWDYVYCVLTPDEVCKVNTLNPPHKGIRANKIHQYLTDDIKIRLTPYIRELIACIDTAPTKQDFEIGYGRHFGGNDQLRIKGL